jgi:pyruvate,orthophosphate dikinase
MSEKKWVYLFGNGKAEGNASLRELLGGKGANLAEMTNLGVPVPPGFTITTEACHYFQDHGEIPPGLEEQVEAALKTLEGWMGSRYGDAANPMLLSVRSGAPISMPGMMDTVLNLGLNEETVEGLANTAGDERFAFDCYRRFLQMYGDVVLGLKPESDGEDPFEVLLAERKSKRGVESDVDLSAEDLKALALAFREKIESHTRQPLATDPREHLWGAIRSVFHSWNTPRAVSYRRIHKLSNIGGTGVNVQVMVFGNLGDDCATGVAFTRDPGSGERKFFGEYLINAQGEDVVAGIRTPQPLSRVPGQEGTSLEETMPGPYRDLVEIYEKLESHYGDMQDLEFTIQKGTLYLLQTRSGKRTGEAAVRMAVEMVEEGLIDERKAVTRVDAESLVQLLSPTFRLADKAEAVREGRHLATGLKAGPGAATGRMVLSAEKALDMVRNKNEKVILVRLETSPEDIAGMHVSEGILTARGGMTSHAAVVARGMGKPCVVGCGELEIDYSRKEFRAHDKVIKQGDPISIDGTTGEVIMGSLPTSPSEVIQVLVDQSLEASSSETYQRFSRLLEWADRFRKMGVRTNADQPDDAITARAFGAEGIGLCRTEHMFFGGERITAVREMILAEDEQQRRRALDKLLPMQRDDFLGLFRAMQGLPVTVRLLDPPLHEFLPLERAAVEKVAEDMKVAPERLRQKVEKLQESNPMLGHRGCRLGITYPEIYEVQVRAIFEAACDLKAQGIDVQPEVMIPLIGTVEELAYLRAALEPVAHQVMKEKGTEVPVVIGTMMEIPRACLVADSVARVAQFFSFGTNDLTQMTFGYSRDDAGPFLADYLSEKKGILPGDPFQSIDQEGVGALVKMGTEKGRSARPDLKVGICGEHGGEPDSIGFCHQVGLDYVSCSPYRVPIARLAAAQAAIREEE